MCITTASLGFFVCLTFILFFFSAYITHTKGCCCGTSIIYVIYFDHSLHYLFLSSLPSSPLFYSFSGFTMLFLFIHLMSSDHIHPPNHSFLSLPTSLVLSQQYPFYIHITLGFFRSRFHLLVKTETYFQDRVENFCSSWPQTVILYLCLPSS